MSFSHTLSISNAFKETVKKYQLVSRKPKRNKAAKATKVLKAKQVKLKKGVRKEL